MRMTNTTNDTMNFLKKDGKVVNGQNETVSIAAGETADIDVDPNDLYVRAAINQSAVIVPEKVAEKAAASAAPVAAKK